MSFRNLQVDPDELPRADRVALAPLAPAYPREVLLQGLLTWTPICFVAAIPLLVIPTPIAGRVVREAPVLPVVLALLALVPLVLALLVVPLAVRRARTAGYAVREHDIVFRRGVLFERTVVLPFRRIQHVQTSSGPLQRRFGLASLKLYTAGASGVDLRIDGLTDEDATLLRDHLVRRSPDEGSVEGEAILAESEGDGPDDEPEPEPDDR